MFNTNFDYLTLLHEMCHYFNDKQGVKDCSRGNTYHNKNFKATAEACDLVVEHHSTYGWSITSPSDALLEFCVENNLTEIRLCRNDLPWVQPLCHPLRTGRFCRGQQAL